jgi:hypothetical protein
VGMRDCTQVNTAGKPVGTGSVFRFEKRCLSPLDLNGASPFAKK